MADRPDANRDRPAGEEARATAREESVDPEEVKSGGHGAPDAPLLTRPQEETLIDGENVTLEWEAVEGADFYLVEVARDAPFHEVVVQEQVEGTSLSLDALPTDGTLYYWRVITRRGGEWSHGDRIESFVSVSVDETTATSEDDAPDQQEDYGPAAALFSSAGAEAAAEATGDDDRFAQEREMGVAHEGVEAGQIIGFAGVVVVAIIIIVCVLFFWITSVAEWQRDTVTERAVYLDLEATETRAAEQLDQYELVSERDSAYRIPIDEAMRIVADEAYQSSEAPEGRGYSRELPIDPAFAPAESLGTGPFTPEPSVPEGPAGAQQQN